MIALRTGHVSHIIDAAFSASSDRIVSGDDHGEILVWNLVDGTILQKLKRPNRGIVAKVRFVHNDTNIVTSWVDSTVSAHKITSGAYTRILRGDSVAPLIATSAQGRYLAIVPWGTRGPITTCDTASSQFKATSEPYRDIDGIALSPDGTRLACMVAMRDQPRRFIMIDLSSGHATGFHKLPSDDTCKSWRTTVDWSADGNTIAMSGPGFVAVCDAKTLDDLWILPSFEGTTCQCSESGQLVVFHPTATEWWDVWSRRRVRRIQGAARSLSPDGRLLMALGGNRIALRDARSGRPIETLGSFSYAEAQRANAQKHFFMAVSNTHPMWARTSPTGLVHVWNPEHYSPLRIIRAHSSEIIALAFHPSGTTLATTARDHQIKIWLASTGELIREITAGCDFDALAFSPDGMSLAASHEDYVKATPRYGVSLFELERGDLIARRDLPLRHDPAHYIGKGGALGHTALRFTPDGQAIIIAAANVLIWWYLRSDRFEVVGEIPHAWSPAFDLDTAMLVVASAEHSMKDNVTMPALIMGPNPEARTTRHELREDHAGVLDCCICRTAPMVVTGSDNGIVSLWSSISGERLHSHETHIGGVLAVAFTADGRILSLGSDGGLCLSDTASGKVIARMVSSDLETWAILCEDGYYCSSRDSVANLQVRRGDRWHPFIYDDLERNRPALIMERLGYMPSGRIRALQKATEIRLMKYPERVATAARTDEWMLALAPGCSPRVSDHPRLVLRIDSGPDRDVAELGVHVNNVALSAVAWRRIEPAWLELAIDLSCGDNNIELQATDIDGSASAPCHLKVAYHPDHHRQPKLYIVSIGISRYADHALDLKYASKDACDIAAVWQASTRFAGVETTLLLDEHATREQILRVCDDLCDAHVDDHLVVFLAGHGALHDGRYYFLPFGGSTTAVAATGIDLGDITQRLRSSPMRQRLILLDTCHAGDLEDVPGETPVAMPGVRCVTQFRDVERAEDKRTSTRDDQEERAIAISEVFGDLRRETGAWILGACGGAELAIESPEERNGVFTCALMRVLRRHLGDHDALRVSQLRREAYAFVLEITRGFQKPAVRRQNTSNDFVVI